MFQLPPIPDVAARLNQMRQSATLAPIQQAQQQRGQVFQPSLPRGGGNGLAQGAAGLGEGLKTVAAVLKERQEEEKAKGFVDNFFNQFDPQSQTMPASFPDGPTGDTAQQITASDRTNSNPFFTEAGWKTARAMRDAGQYVPLMGMLQTRMMQPPKGPERTKTGEGEIIWEHRPDGTTVKIAEGPAKSTAPTSDRGKLRKEFELGEHTVEEYEAKLADLNKEGKFLTREDLKNFGYRPGTVAYWKDGAPHVAQAPEATEKSVPGLDVPLSPEVLAQQIEKQRALGQNATENRPFTEGETKSAGFAVRMDNANEKLAALTKEGFDPTSTMAGLAGYAGMLPIIGNKVQGEGMRRYQQLMNDWVSANLRKESGAVLGEDEIENEAKKYFPMPGGDAATVAQKAESRRLAESAMRVSAGKAYDAILNDRRGKGSTAGWTVTRKK
jgi:hypothetical protein